jgi:alpha-L-fucosidase 2
MLTTIDSDRTDRFDPVWNPLPTVDYEAVPMANGWVGASGWLDSDRLRFDLGHQSFWAFRDPVLRDPSRCTFETYKDCASRGDNEAMQRWLSTTEEASSRLPGIAVVLEGSAVASLQSAVLHLRSAEALWRGEHCIASRVDFGHPWLVLEGDGPAPSTDGSGSPWNITLQSAFDTPESDTAKRLSAHGVSARRVGPDQLLLVGTDCSLGVGVTVLPGDGRWQAVICVVCESTEADVLRALSREMQSATEEPVMAARDRHREAWEQMMTRSLIELPEPRLEALYWLELYLLASVGCNSAPLISLQGPWTFMDRWPAWNNDLHHNVNTEMSYWSAWKTGLHEVGEGLKSFLWQAQAPSRESARQYFGRDGLILAHSTDIRGCGSYTFPVGHFCWSNGLWLAQTLYEHCLYSGDCDTIDALVVPWIRESLRVLISELSEGRDGKLHLDHTFSPEYGGVGFARPIGPDATIDLVLVRWSIDTLKELAGDDPEVQEWMKVLERLAEPARHPYVQHHQVDEPVRPFMVRRDMALETSHRHHSHLISVFPLELHDPRDATQAELLKNCMYELMFRGHGEWVGFSFVWAAAIASHARLANPALGLLRDYCDRYATRNGWMVQGSLGDIDFNSHLQNSWGVGVVTLEGPLAFPCAVMELLLQDAHERIEVFPAVPTIWADAAFQDLRTKFGVTVSARMRERFVTSVDIAFTRDGDCVLVNPWEPELGVIYAVSGECEVILGADIRIHGKQGAHASFKPSSC